MTDFNDPKEFIEFIKGVICFKYHNRTDITEDEKQKLMNKEWYIATTGLNYEAEQEARKHDHEFKGYW